MQEIINLFIGTLILALGFPIGNYLSKITKEELKDGQKWFKLIILVSLIGSLTSAFFRNDYLLFSFLFMAIVTSKSLKKN